MQKIDQIASTDRRIAPTATALDRAIVATIAYSDIFDYPLRANEIHRYLIGVAATRAEVDAAVALSSLLSDHLTSRDDYVMLTGKEHIAGTRQDRQEDSGWQWRAALRYGRIIASLPFVRMVAVTGELAMDNVQPSSDIDYFIVTRSERLWLCRLLIIGVVRYAAIHGVTVCPNYLVAERSLVIHERNLYAAHEVAQMVPIAGHTIYRQFRQLNDWVTEYLPNAAGPPRERTVRPVATPLRRLAEWALSGWIGGRIERWEMDRKIRRLSRIAGPVHEASFSPEWCKGHVSGHEGRILAAFDDRRRRLEDGVS